MHINDGFTIVVPTYCEANNIKELLKRIHDNDFRHQQFEIILVDDNSQDGTIEIVNELIRSYPHLKLIIRQGKRNLSAAILDGLLQAKFALVVTMDADLSHPPEKINELLNALINNNADLVIGSRYVTGGNVDPTWPLPRKIASRLSAFVARKLFVPNITDPLSGFLALNKEKILSISQLEPIGWKIGLEIIVKCHCKNIYEVPIHFSQRLRGKSKLNFKIASAYFYHIFRLLQYKLSLKKFPSL